MEQVCTQMHLVPWYHVRRKSGGIETAAFCVVVRCHKWGVAVHTPAAMGLRPLMCEVARVTGRIWSNRMTGVNVRWWQIWANRGELAKD